MDYDHVKSAVAIQSNSEVIVKPYRQGPIRFVQLMVTAFVFFGSQYAFNNPQALQEDFQHDLGINQVQFNLLYTIVAFPNIFTTFFIGFLIDFLGVRIGIVTLASGVVIFQLIIASGAFFSSYHTILVGRALLGIAAESVVTAQATMISIWFKGKQLAFALGIAITFPELGNALNSFLSPLIYNKTQSLGVPLLFSVVICMISAGCAIGSAFIDYKADKYDAQNIGDIPQSSQDGTQVESGQHIKLSDLKSLKGSFWLIIALCMFSVSEYVPFMDNVNRMFIKRFCLTEVVAGRFVMTTYIVAAASSAPLGILIDKVGFKRYFIMGCFVVFLTAQSLILLWPTCTNELAQSGPIAGLVLIGIGYGFYANSIVASIPLVCKKKVLGTAFGLMGMAQALSQAVIPLLSGVIVQSQGGNDALGYKYSSLFFTLFALAGLLISFLLFFISDKVKAKLDAASKPKKFKTVIINGIEQVHEEPQSPQQQSHSEEDQKHHSETQKNGNQAYFSKTDSENNKDTLKQSLMNQHKFDLELV